MFKARFCFYKQHSGGCGWQESQAIPSDVHCYLSVTCNNLNFIPNPYPRAWSIHLICCGAESTFAVVQNLHLQGLVQCWKGEVCVLFLASSSISLEFTETSLCPSGPLLIPHIGRELLVIPCSLQPFQSHVSVILGTLAPPEP